MPDDDLIARLRDVASDLAQGAYEKGDAVTVAGAIARIERLEKRLAVALAVNAALASETSTASVPSTVDHPVLDVIARYLKGDNPRGGLGWRTVRQSECLEFRDPRDGKHFEIIVREIDGEED